jgi:hypothetical protein
VLFVAVLGACTTTPDPRPNETAQNEPPLEAFNGGPRATTQGSFGPVKPWPVISVHAILMPNGKVMTFSTTDGTGATRNEPPENNRNTGTKVDVWDPATDTHIDASNPTQLQHNLFCSSHTILPSGEVFVTGGHTGSDGWGIAYFGDKSSHTFNPFTNVWTKGKDMNSGRWYPTSVTLGNGDITVIGGLGTKGDPYSNALPQIWQLGTQSWRSLTSATTDNLPWGFDHLYPMLHLAPDGRVVALGPNNAVRSLNTTGTGAWTFHGARDDTYRFAGNSVQFEPNKVLVIGGGTFPLGWGTSVASTTIVNLETRTASSGKPLNFRRAQQNATILPDGTVFVNGGNTSSQNFEEDSSVFESELWNPATGDWTIGARAQVQRNYHSTSLLLPDGRVLTMGGGMCGDCYGKPQINKFSAEIYHPPYLFKKDGSGQLAARPEVLNLSPELRLAQKTTLRFRSTSAALSVALLRLGSVTHGVNFDQRRVPLEFRVADNAAIPQLEVTLPSDADVLPVGHYMLFVVNADGVPSVGRIVRVQ